MIQELNIEGNIYFKNVFNKEADKLDWIKDNVITPERQYLIKKIIDLNSVFILYSCVTKISKTRDVSLKELREQIELIYDALKSNNSDPE